MRCANLERVSTKWNRRCQPCGVIPAKEGVKKLEHTIVGVNLVPVLRRDRFPHPTLPRLRGRERQGVGTVPAQGGDKCCSARYLLF